jgi:hypothetical protein
MKTKLILAMAMAASGLSASVCGQEVPIAGAPPPPLDEAGDSDVPPLDPARIPASEILQGDTGTALVSYHGNQLHYAIFANEVFAKFEVNTAAGKSRSRQELGRVNFGGGQIFPFSRKIDPLPPLDRTVPDMLTLNGQEFDLRNGRLLFIHQNGKASQMGVFPVLQAVRNANALAGLEKENELGNAIRATQRQLGEIRDGDDAAEKKRTVLQEKMAILEKQLHDAAIRTHAAYSAGLNRPGTPDAAGGVSRGKLGAGTEPPAVWLEVRPNGSVVFADVKGEVAPDEIVTNIRKRMPVATSVGVRASAEIPFAHVARVLELLKGGGYGVQMREAKEPRTAAAVEAPTASGGNEVITQIELKVMRQQYAKVLQQMFDAELQIEDQSAKVLQQVFAAAAGELEMDPMVAKNIGILQTTNAEEAKMLESGIGENHPRVRALRAQREVVRKQLVDQLENLKPEAKVVAALRERAAVMRRYAERLRSEILAKGAPEASEGVPSDKLRRN